ncbi:MAG: HAMP domain-containing protein [Thermoflexales bacterium]|nr:HAMP domain-containing protein [Thermoflexales bacterium]
MPVNGVWPYPYFEFPARQAEGWFVLALYALLLLGALASQWRVFAQLKRQEWVTLLACLAAALILNYFPRWIYAHTPLPVPGRPQETLPQSVPLLGLVPVLAAGAWLGAGPASLVALVAGLTRLLFGVGWLTQVAEALVFGVAAAFLVRQDYRGRLWAVLRRPLAAGIIGALLSWPFVLPSLYLYTPGGALYALDYSWPLFLEAFVPTLLMGLSAGLIMQGLYLALPALQPVRQVLTPPPYARSLNRRLLFIFIPLFLLVIGVLLYAVTATALNAATRQAIAQMSRDAASASGNVAYFFQTGQSLMDSFATDERLQSGDAPTCQQQLVESARAGAFFDQLLLFDRNGDAIAQHPQDADTALTQEEDDLLARVLNTGAPQFSQVHMRSGTAPIISFVVQVPGQTEGERFGALLGRAQLDVNPIMNGVRAGLQQTLGSGEGFLLDAQNRIVVHPDASRLLLNWQLDPDLRVISEKDGGRAFINYAQDGTHRLLLVRAVEGQPWTAVIELPYSAVLGLAAQISMPLLILLIVLVIVSAVFVTVVTPWLTRPLVALAQAAQQIADGKLDAPVQVGGEDEVGRLGQSFEQMRLRLRGQLQDLSLLLRASQEVAAASLDVQRGAPPILASALEASPARCSRLVMFSNDGVPKQVISAGSVADQGLTPLDHNLAERTSTLDAPWLVENVGRTRSLLNPSIVWPGIHALALFPVRRQKQTLGALWLAYDEAHRFVDQEVNLLSTLAGQAAVVAENTRLFMAAEDGRQRLLAILNSTGDAVIVTDPLDRVLLLNPAAELAFDVRASAVAGHKLADIIEEPTVLQLLTTLQSQEPVQTGEVLLRDGRTLYGNASAIVVNDPHVKGSSHVIGRVAVMRDVTHFKELDAIKSQFVATVSHDLRSPLTYMRGYTTMLPMVGPLNDKQSEYIDKISNGIQQMTDLIEDLLDLGRIEARVGLQRQLCILGEVVTEVCEELRSYAIAKGLNLQVEIDTRRSLQADPALLKRAMTNLLDNAIKYTPSGGTVLVGLTEQSDSLILRFKDNGIGIAPGDQARLFERFYRVKRRDTSDIKGSGLGLAIVKSIAEWHGGRVWVDSQLGAGSTFYMAIPIVTTKDIENQPEVRE